MVSSYQKMLLVSIVMVAGAVGISARVTEIITNDLEGHQTLRMECKDKHGSFGIREVPFGRTYEFNFKPTLIGADYFCWFNFDNTIHWFDIYKTSRLVGRDCADNTCHWSVKEAGPCTVEYQECLPWN